MIKQINTLIYLLALSLVVGCASRPDARFAYPNIYIPPKINLKVAVLPFENLTSHLNAGVIVTQLMDTEIYARHIFHIPEDTRLRRFLKKDKKNVIHIPNTTYARDAARRLKVDAVVVGSVSEYAYQNGLHEEPVVGINIRIVSQSGLYYGPTVILKWVGVISGVIA